MDFTPSQSHRSSSRSRSKTRNTGAGSRSGSSSRRPSIGSQRRSLSSSSINRLVITPATIDFTDKSIPSVHVTLDNSLPLEFFKQELVGLIKALRISKWHKRQLVVANVSVTRITGALTNSIYKIEYNDPLLGVQPPSLLLRVYGKNVDSIIDRESELRILVKLSAKKIGPKLLGIFTNGRFEQFLEGFITMSKNEIRHPVISQMLGRRMKDLHYKIEMDDQDRLLELPVAWIQILKWLHLFESQILPLYDQHQIEETLLMPWSEFRTLVFTYRGWLFEKYDQDRFTDNYKFCHNDTQYGNLLLRDTFDPKDVTQSHTDLPVLVTTSSKKDKDLAVIDFEYSGPNFPAYDIADHFSEWMSDYHNLKKPYAIHEAAYPSKIDQLNLLKSYVEYDFQFPSSNLKTRREVTTANTDAQGLIEFEAKKMYNEIIYWRATVQIFWCIWGLIQNGPPKDAVESLGSKSEEQGVTSTYSITTGMDAMALDECAIEEEEAITNLDDDFDYLKYSKEKAGLILGDMVAFGFVGLADVKPEYHSSVKYLDAQDFDL